MKQDDNKFKENYAEEQTPKRRVRFWIISIFGYILIALSLFIFVIYLFPKESLPEPVRPVIEDIQTQVDTTIDKTIHEVKTINVDKIPLKVGTVGGVYEIDQCDGTFTEYPAYEQAGLQPSYLAHNYCGGSAILYEENGAMFEISFPDNSVKYYKLVDSIVVPQRDSTTDMILGLKGDIYFQSCFFDRQTMRFIGLQEINEDGSLINSDVVNDDVSNDEESMDSIPLEVPN